MKTDDIIADMRLHRAARSASTYASDRVYALLDEIDVLRRHRDDLHEANNRYLERARKAEAALSALSPAPVREPGPVTEPVAWIDEGNLEALLSGSKHDFVTVYKSDEAAGLNMLDCGKAVPLFTSRPGLSFEKAPILKGIGKRNGDGWKDTTSVGEVVFVWNRELEPPYAPGQFPRIGNEGWSASREQYEFSAASASEVEEFLANLSGSHLSRAEKAEADLVRVRRHVADHVEHEIELAGKLKAAESVIDDIAAYFDAADIDGLQERINEVQFCKPGSWSDIFIRFLLPAAKMAREAKPEPDEEPISLAVKRDPPPWFRKSKERKQEPHEAVGVRELARIAGISPSTASRFKAGMAIDAKTIKALHAAGMITKCPHCEAELKGGEE